MGKKLAIKGHSTHGRLVIELLEMVGGKDIHNLSGCDGYAYYIDSSNDMIICSNENLIKYNLDKYQLFTLEEFWEIYPFKIGDKVFLYDNITEGCVTGMEWDEDKGTIKYRVYTSGEYWCDVKELLKWNPIEFLEVKHCNGKQVNEMKNVLTELLNHIKNTPREELEREFEEIKEWTNVGPTVEEFMTFCECVNKKPKYPDNYGECVRIAKNIHGYDIHIDVPAYGKLMESFVKLLICRDAYWKIAGEELGLDKPWEPKFGKCLLFDITFYFYQDNFVLHKGEYLSSDNCILVFPSEEMRDAFYENFKDLIEDCKELL